MKERGMILLKEVQYLLLAVAVIAILLIAGSRVYSMVSASQAENQAKGTLENFANFLKNLPEGKADSFLIYSPEGYWLVSYSKTEQSFSECYQKDCICICENEDCKNDKAWCKTLSKPVISEKKSIKISINTLVITNKPESYALEIYSIKNGKEEAVSLSDKCEGKLVTLENGFRLKESVILIWEEAQKIAKENNKYLILVSAYRDHNQQELLWNQYKDPTIVCDPNGLNVQEGKLCPHMTGCAVDVKICPSTICESKDIPMGFSNDDTKLLEKIMTSAGFVRYKNEYWHFEYGTNRWQTCNSQNTKVC